LDNTGNGQGQRDGVQMIFLASLPRSGSTLLTCLLNQRPDVYASPTSNLCDTMGAAVQAWEQNPTTQASGGTKKDLVRILKGIAKSRYATKQTVFDKGRGWSAPQIIETMKKVQGGVKIVTTVRPIADCLSSFVKLTKPDNVRDFCRNSQLAEHLMSSYHTIKAGYEAYPECFLFVEYDDLVKDPQTQLDRIAEFVGLDRYEGDINNVEDSKEEDEVWGIKDLHKVRKKVSKRRYSVRRVLGDELYSLYQGGEFWNDKPEPVRKEDLLDLQLEASLRGDFKKAGQITDKLLIERPNCDRVKFNAGWQKLYKGDLQAGHKLLDAGRAEDLFGNRFESSQPCWNGEPGTILLNMEGGLGDQIKSYRFAFDIQAKGNRVVIACASELAPMFAENFITVQHEAALGVFHDYWVPSMSAIIPLGHTYETLSGKPYITKTADTIPGRVGVRWSGNPQFEHEQHRKFPPELLFDAVRHLNPVSLQRDTDDVPSWMEKVDLSDWQATREEISKCALVISSCTSVAHMSAAMGVPTWVVVPILPYYLWALPGNKSPYYDSVTLFRQEKYGDWSGPFKNIKENLQCMHTLKMAA